MTRRIQTILTGDLSVDGARRLVALLERMGYRYDWIVMGWLIFATASGFTIAPTLNVFAYKQRSFYPYWRKYHEILNVCFLNVFLSLPLLLVSESRCVGRAGDIYCAHR
jgi:hypothetical protein